MVDRHYSFNLKPWSARTLCVYAHADLAQKYFVGLQGNFCLQVVLPRRKFFFPALDEKLAKSFLYIPFASIIIS
jgi:hypothetical protein